LPFSNEPSGVGYKPCERTLFVSDDDNDRIYVDRSGPDGVHGTADDSVTSFSTSAFGANDPEGVEYDAGRARLNYWIVDRQTDHGTDPLRERRQALRSLRVAGRRAAVRAASLGPDARTRARAAGDGVRRRPRGDATRRRHLRAGAGTT
jgi:hypothetical protein